MTASPTRRKRRSKAAVARIQAEIEARPQGRNLSPVLAEVIARYESAEATGPQMLRIRPFLVASITASSLTGPDSVRKNCNHLTRLALYALERGIPLEVAAVLSTAFIDEYVRIAMSGAQDHLRAERRRRLLSVARTANPGPSVPANLSPIGHSSIKPCYSPTELAVIQRACRVQPTRARQRSLAIVVSLGAGGGLDSVDLRDLTAAHIEDLGGAGLRIQVQGPRPRVVVVRARFESLLREAIAEAAPQELLLGRKQDRRNTAARAVENAALHNVPHIEPARLRSTWLADLMTDAVPLALILQAAGLRSARTLSELQPHLGPWLEHKGYVLPTTVAVSGLLRGETR